MKEHLEKQLETSKEFIENLPWENEDFYADYLAQTYYFVCHSTRLLGRSLSYFHVNDKDDLYKRFKDHISEEDNHEKIALSDLIKLGREIDSYKKYAITSAFYESQYFKIEQSKGTALLGYILYLEAIAIHCFPNVVGRLFETYGRQKSQFLKVHVEEDPSHVDKALEEIAKLSEPEQKEIWDNFFQTADLYHLVLRQVQENAQLFAEKHAA